MPRLVATFAAVLMMTTSFGCAELDTDSDGETEVGRSGHQIIGGQLSFDFPAVGSLTTTDGDEFSFCTATLIGCQTVLTAAHCVCSGRENPCTAKSPSEMRVFFQHSGFHEVASIDYHPEYDAIGLTSDIAVIQLKEPVTGIEPVAIADSGRPGPGASITMSGFGISNRDGIESGIKRDVDVSVAQCGVGEYPNESVTHHLCYETTAQTYGFCQGDSGGPAFGFIDGRPIVAGVASYVRHENLGTADERRCTDPVSANVSTYAGWVKSRAQEAVGPQSCSALPALDHTTSHPQIWSQGFQADFSASEIFEVDIEIPEGASELRLTWNNMYAKNYNGANRRLPYEFSYSTAPEDSGVAQRASLQCSTETRACILRSPKPGLLTARVVNSNQLGEAQITATIIGGAPIARADSFTATSGQPLIIAADQGLLANDQLDMARGGNIEIVGQPQNGTLELNSDGSFTYNPSPEFVGYESFTYEVVDDEGYASDEVVVEINVQADEGDQRARSGGVSAGCSAGATGGSGPMALLLMAMAMVMRQRRRR
ncbi:MAG: trypsin-like serine protease [Deltaproteobacteria bacterium]|nr:trypsin-like serine protease [Deltaproteobacteria bacterium]